MDSEKVIKRDNEYVLHTYNRNPIVLEKGHGLYAEGPEGQKYLDFTSGIGVNSLGYCDLAWAEAVSQQAHKLQHTSNLYYTAPCGKLAKKLCKRTGMSKVFFGNSGAEANEGAIKAARKYSVDHYGKDRYNVITLVNSFHGRTLATLTATGQEVFHNYFGPFNEGFQYVPAGDIEALRELVDRHTCAVMMELIQGEGGVMAMLPAFIHDILHHGPEGLGILRAMPAAGSVCVGLWLARHPLQQHAGRVLLFAVAGFGLAVIAFGLSRSFWLSAAILLFYGMCDGVSVVVRSTILQLSTPDEMRGRVSSINGIFVSSSNELGAFYAGTMARLLGLVPAVILGGFAILSVAGITAWKAPRLRRLDLRELQ